MEPKKVLASVFLTATLVLAPVSTAVAAPAGSPPGVTDVRHNDHDRNDYRGDRHDQNWNNNHRHDRDRGWDNRWDNQWQPNCFWFGPWLMCMPW